MRKTKGFSYTENELDVIAHIDIQQNGSRYIWELVRKDMNAKSIETIVREQVEKAFKGYNLGKTDSPQIDTRDIKNIMNI